MGDVKSEDRVESNGGGNLARANPLKIALLTRRYPPLIGGAEKVLSYLALALANEGAEVHVLTSLPSSHTLQTEELVETNQGSLTIHRLRTSRLRFLGTWIYMRNLRRWLENHPIDMTYVSMLKHDAYVAVEAGKKLGFPVVLRPEGAGATGDLAWQSWGRFGRKIGQQTRQADALVVISKAIEDELLQAGYDKNKLHRLPNGVPIPEQPWQRREGWRSAPRAVYVGRLATEKGIDTLIEAWKMVRQEYSTAQLTLYGEGPERPTLEAGVGKLGLGDAITFAGSVADPTEALRKADLFVLPSREEGMSIALLEAMALGIPIVASSIPGNRRLILDYKTGRLAPPDDPRALALVILEQFHQFDRAFHLSRAARQKVLQEFSIASVAKSHLKLFQSLITKTSSKL